MTEGVKLGFTKLKTWMNLGTKLNIYGKIGCMLVFPPSGYLKASYKTRETKFKIKPWYSFITSVCRAPFQCNSFSQTNNKTTKNNNFLQLLTVLVQALLATVPSGSDSTRW